MGSVFQKVDVTDGDRQGIGRIGGREFRKIQDRLDHHLDLRLFRPAVADDGLFDLQGAVFINRRSAMCFPARIATPRT